MNGHLEATKLLVAANGIHLDYQGPSNGYTPLHDALWHGYEECARVILQAGASVSIVAYDGKLPIDIAIEVLGENSTIVAELREATNETSK